MAKYRGIAFYAGGHPEDLKEVEISDIMDDLGTEDLNGNKIMRANIDQLIDNAGIVIKLYDQDDKISAEYYLRKLHDNNLTH
jgi:hypothetical protein